MNTPTEELRSLAIPYGTFPELAPLRTARSVWRFAQRKPVGAFSALLILMMVVVAVVASLGLIEPLTGYGYDQQVLRNRLAPPSSGHLLGTDNLGRDLLTRVLYGARVSITIGFSAVLLSETLGLAIGMTSGFLGGRVDTLVQRVVDVWQAMPGLLMLIFLIAVFGRSIPIMVAVIGVLGAARSSRLMRGATLGVRSEQYMEAARALGASNIRMLVRHVLPNIFHVLLISISVSIGSAILVESTLSFLGLGLPPPYPTWGRMLNDSRGFLSSPWLAVVPGLAITLTVFAFNMLGDALRDVLDPRLRGSR